MVNSTDSTAVEAEGSGHTAGEVNIHTEAEVNAVAAHVHMVSGIADMVVSLHDDGPAFHTGLALNTSDPHDWHTLSHR